MKKVKKIKVFAYAKFQAMIMGFAGIIPGLMYSVGGTIVDLTTIGLNHGTALAYFAIPVMPIYAAVIGFVSGLIGAFLYNLVAKWMDVKDMDFEL